MTNHRPSPGSREEAAAIKMSLKAFFPGGGTALFAAWTVEGQGQQADQSVGML